MRALLLFLSLLTATPATFALNCGQASTPLEQTICKQPDLARLDAELNTVYDRLRPKLTPAARATVLSQQRAWLAQRNHLCANGDVSCLHNAYGTRLEYLEALDAAASTTDTPWGNLHPLVIHGMWKASAIHDPGAKEVSGPTDLPYSLSEAELPAVGALVSASPGKLCIQGHPCAAIAWKQTTLGKLEGVAAMHRVLGLPEDAPVLLGDQGARMSPSIILVQRDGGVIWAIFSLGAKQGDSDHYAAEEWTPTGSAATIATLP